MRKRKIVWFVIFIVACFGCKKEREEPKVIYDQSEKQAVIPKPKVDSTQIKIADLPIHMEGTRYLIYPIGGVRIYEGRSKVVFGGSTSYMSFSISNYNRFELTGDLDNLKFQHVDSTRIRTLTKDRVLIQTVTFLNAIAEKYKKNILVYVLIDSDTNKDGKWNGNDVKSLYISTIKGTHFTKLTPPYSELIDWNVLESQGKLYFRTIEDTNKNGAFDKKDLMHYYYVNLNDSEWNPVAYDPFLE